MEATERDRLVGNGAEYKQDQTPEGSCLSPTPRHSSAPRSLPACIFCSVFNRNPGVMAGLATSAGISSFITWSTCSGHRSLTCLRSLTTYTGARRGHLATHRPLDKAVTVNGPSQISRVCFSISRVSPPVLLTLHPTYWKPAALPRFYISVSAQGPVSSARC